MAKLKISYPAFRQPACVIFGTGSLRTLSDVASLDQTAIFLSAREEVCAAVAKVLAPSGKGLTSANSIVKPPGEPTAEMVEAGAMFLRQGTFGRIVAVGGGSVLDWCRLAWAASQGLLVLETGRVTDAGPGHVRPEIWLIPTTCATGAEAAGVAVYSYAARKLPAVSPAFLADRVILDGRFLDSVPAGTLACFLCDALSHAIEGFVSIVPNYLAKEMALAALHLVLAHYSAEKTASRHERLMEAGYLGGVAASNCSVGVTHAFAHSVAGWGVSHSLGNALGLVAGMEINADTPAMQNLLARTGHGDLAQLIECIRPIVREAIASQSVMPIIERLRDPAGRGEIIQRMQGDVCLRSNPQPLVNEELNAFVDRVIATVEAER